MHKYKLPVLVAGALVVGFLSHHLISSGNRASEMAEMSKKIFVARGNPDKALELLKKGNAAYVKGDFRTFSPKERAEHRETNKEYGQFPIASILGCADSRQPVEDIFNMGTGEIFVVRTAGNTAGVDQTASLEFSVAALNVPVIVVMGHTACGAVDAATKHAKFPEHALGKLMDSFAPVVRETDKLPEEDRLNQGTIININRTISELEANKIIGGAVKEGKVKIVGALYDIETGEVKFLDRK